MGRSVKEKPGGRRSQERGVLLQGRQPTTDSSKGRNRFTRDSTCPEEVRRATRLEIVHESGLLVGNRCGLGARVSVASGFCLVVQVAFHGGRKLRKARRRILPGGCEPGAAEKQTDERPILIGLTPGGLWAIAATLGDSTQVGLFGQGRSRNHLSPRETNGANGRQGDTILSEKKKKNGSFHFIDDVGHANELE